MIHISWYLTNSFNMYWNVFSLFLNIADGGENADIHFPLHSAATILGST